MSRRGDAEGCRPSPGSAFAPPLAKPLARPFASPAGEQRRRGLRHLPRTRRLLTAASSVLLALSGVAVISVATSTPVGAQPPSPSIAWGDVTGISGTPPSARADAASAYDPQVVTGAPSNGAVLLFGGESWDAATSTATDDGGTWLYTGQGWSAAQISGSSPSARTGAAAAYDPATGQVVLFGGSAGGTAQGDTWVFTASSSSPDAGTWTEADAGGAAQPAPRSYASMAYDAQSGQLLLYGGLSASGSALDDTWAWDPSSSTWVEQSVWLPGSSPGGLVAASMVYDPSTEQLLLAGGDTSSTLGTSPSSGTFVWSGDLWQRVSSLTVGTEASATAYDPAMGAVVSVGGTADLFNGIGLGSVSTWNGRAWTQLSSNAAVPPAATGASLVYDQATQSLVLFGGSTTPINTAPTATSFVDSTWIASAAPAWGAQTTSASGLAQASVAYDPQAGATGALVMFGGAGSGASASGTTFEYLPDPAAPPAHSWQPVTTSSAPPARYGAAMAYDPNTPGQGEDVLFGGVDSSGNLLDDTWVFDATAATWTQVATSGTQPPALYGATMAYDSTSGDLVLTGGATTSSLSSIFSGSTTQDFSNETWLFNGTSWSELPASSTVTPSVVFASSAPDPSSGGIVVTGGWGLPTSGLIDVPQVVGETWTFANGAWTRGPANPDPTFGSVLVDDTAIGADALFGGYSTTSGSAVTNPAEEWTAGGWSPLASTTAGASALNATGYATAAFDPGLDSVVYSDGSTGAPGQLPSSPVAGVQQLEQPASAPTGVEAQWDDTTGVADVTWGAATGGSSPVSSYNIYVNGTLATSTPTTSAQLTGFSGGTVDVTSVTADGLESPSYDQIEPMQLSSASNLYTDFNPPESWTASSDTTPGAVSGEAMAAGVDVYFGPSAGSFVMFGGVNSSGTPLATTYTWDAGSWTLQAPLSSPSARSQAAMAFDPASGTDLLFGGEDASRTAQGDTWEWNGNDWSQASPATSPPARYGAVMADDTATGQVVLFGGTGAAGQPLNDTWVWNGSSWSQVDDSGAAGCASTCPQSPSPRTGGAMAYDPLDGQLVLFGGTGSSGQALGDTWIWNGSTWIQQQPRTSPPAAASPAGGPGYAMSFYQDGSVPRGQSQLEYHEGSYGYEGGLVLAGGGGSSLGTWLWNGSTWRQFTQSGQPGGLSDAAMAFDSTTGETVLYGGLSNSGATLSGGETFGGPTYSSSIDYQPNTLTATPAGAGSIQLSWSDQLSPAPDGHEIFVGTSAGGESPSPLLVEPDSNLVTVSGLQDGTTYYFTVEDLDQAGASAPSSEASATPPGSPPGAPSLTGQAGAAGALLDWTPPSSTGTSGISGYDIFEGSAGPGSEGSTPVATAGSSATSYQLTGLTNGTGYVFTVKAANLTGDGAASNEVSLTPSATAPPYAPTGLTATGSGYASASLNWTAPVSANGSAITSYEVEESSSASGPFAPLASEPASATSATVSGLPNGQRVYLELTADSADGASAPSNVVTASPGEPNWVNVPVNTPNGITWPMAATDSTNGTVVYVDGSYTTWVWNGSVWTKQSPPSPPSFVSYMCMADDPLNGGVLLYGLGGDTSIWNGTTWSQVSTSGPSGETGIGCEMAWDPALGEVVLFGGYRNDATWGWNGSQWSQLPATASPPDLTGGGMTYDPTSGDLVLFGGSVNLGSSDLDQTWLYNGSTWTQLSQAGPPPARDRVQLAVEPSTDQVVMFGGGIYSATTSDYGIFTDTWVLSGPAGSEQWVQQAPTDSPPGAGGGTTTEATDTATGNIVVATSAETWLYDTPPTAPSGATARVSGTTATVGWTPPALTGGSPITGYDVFANGSTTPIATADASASSVQVPFLTAGTPYTFTVAAENAIGQSAPSQPSASVTPTQTSGTPSAPDLTSAVAAPSGQAVTLTWNAPSSDGGSAITGYDLYEATSSGGEGTAPLEAVGGSQATGNTVTISGLSDGTTYYFTVAAVNANGAGAQSDELSAVPDPAAPPAAPQLSVGAVESGAISISWTDSGDIASYQVEDGVGAAPSQVVATLPATASSYTLTGLGDGTPYQVMVVATNNAGSTDSNVIAQTPAGPPSAPLLLPAVAGNATLTLSWVPQASNGSTITGYAVDEVTYSGSSASAQLVASLSAGTTSWSTSSGVGGPALSLTDGTTYYFEVEALSNVGDSPFSSVVSGVPSGAPSAPRSLAAVAGNGLVTLDWQAPQSNGGSAITGYAVYESTASGQELASPAVATTAGTATSTVISGLTNGTTYDFEVEAVNAAGASSGPSNEAGAAPVGPPGAPALTAAAAGNGQVTLSWTPPSSFGGASSSGAYYTIYEGTSSGGEGASPVLYASSSPMTVTGLTNGTQYYFTVEAVTSVGSSAASDELSATPLGQPSAPQNPQAVAGPASAVISWTPPASDGGSAITGYDIFDSTGAVSTSPASAAVARAGPAATSASVSGLQDGQSYTFEVVAVNGVGSGLGAPSAPVSATPVSPPAAPTSVTATPGNGTITVGWQAPSDDGGSAITGYGIYLGTSPGQEPATPTETAAAGATSAQITGLAKGTTYYLTVAARNGPAGFGTPSAEAGATPAASPSAPVLSVRAVASGQVALAWGTPVASGTISGYDVLESTSSSMTGATTAVSSATEDDLAGLTNGTRYYLEVEAIVGGVAGPPSNEVSAVPAPPSSAPGAPTGLGALPGSGQVTLSWTAPSSVSTSLEGYDVYPATSSGSESSKSAIFVPASSTPSYVATGLTNGTPYYFQVAAVNSAGVGAASAEVEATPATAPGAPLGLTASGGNGEVALSWKAPDSGGAPITDYTISEGGTLVQTVSGATSTTIGGLTNGAAVTFSVAAQNLAGTGPASTASATPQAASISVTGFAAAGPQVDSVQTVPDTAIPSAALTTAASSASATGSDDASAPLGSIPLGSIPLGSIPLGSIPLGSIALGSSSSNPATAAAGRALSQTSLADLSVTYPAGCSGASCTGWSGILAGTAYVSDPLQSVTLGDVFSSTTATAALDSLHLADLGVAGSPLGSIPLGSIPLGSIPLGSIPLPGTATGASQSTILQGWCAELASLQNSPYNCSSFGIDPGASNPNPDNVTLITLALAGVPLGSIPLGSIPLGSIPLGSIPLGSAPLGSIPLGSISLSTSPLGSIPLGSIPLGSIPLGSIPLGSIPLGSIPLGSIPLGSIPLGSIPLGSIPLGSIPLGSIPLGSIPLGSIPLGSIPLGSIPLGSIPLGSIPLGSIPLGSIPLGSIPLGSIPLGSIPLGSIGSIVNCADIACSSTTITLADAESLGFLAGGATLNQLVSAIPSTATADLADVSNTTLAQLSDYGSTSLGDLLSAVTASDASFVNGTTLSQLASYGTITLAELVSAIQQAATNSSLPQSELAALQAALAAALSSVGSYGTTTLAQFVSAVQSDSSIYPCLGPSAGSCTDVEQVVAGDNTSASGYPSLTLEDLLLALEPPQSYPWPSLDLAKAPLAGAGTSAVNEASYQASISVGGASGQSELTQLTLQLPPTFAYVAGSASLSGPSAPALPAPSTSSTSSGSSGSAQTVSWTVPLQAGSSYTLSFQADAGTGLGNATATLTASLVGLTPTSSQQASVDVVDGLAGAAAPAPLTTGTLNLGYLQNPGQTEQWAINVYSGQELSLDLSNLAADYDLELFQPVSGGNEQNLQQAPGSTALPVADTLPALDPTSTVESTPGSQSVPVAPPAGYQLYEVSSNTATAADYAAAAGQQSLQTSPLPAGTYVVQVSGFDGATSPQPYALQAQLLGGTNLLSCAGPAYTAGAAPELIEPVPSVPTILPGTNTLFLVDTQRMAAAYGSAGESAVMNELGVVASDASAGVSGAVLPVDAYPLIRAAYEAWDQDPCSVQAADAVVAAIDSQVTALRAAYPSIANIVILGADDQIPFARLTDGTVSQNERDYAAQTFLGESNVEQAAMADGYYLSDDPYAASPSSTIGVGGESLYLPTAGIGRLIETPQQIVGALSRFVTSGGNIDATSGLTTGYSFLSTGAALAAANLANDSGLTMQALINDTWSKTDLQNALDPVAAGTSSAEPAVDALNAHFDYSRALPAIGNSTGTATDLFTTSDVAADQAAYAGRLLFSVGCHSGLDIDQLEEAAGGGPSNVQDWATTFANAGALWVANTGYGYGDTTDVAYSAALMADFAGNIGRGQLSIGQALAEAVQQYQAGNALLSPYDIKSMMESTLYGLPMYSLSVPSGSTGSVSFLSSSANAASIASGSTAGSTSGTSAPLGAALSAQPLALATSALFGGTAAGSSVAAPSSYGPIPGLFDSPVQASFPQGSAAGDLEQEPPTGQPAPTGTYYQVSNGVSYTGPGGAIEQEGSTQTTEYRPIEPLDTIDVTQPSASSPGQLADVAHGALFTGLTSIDVPDPNPAISQPNTDTAATPQAAANSPFGTLERVATTTGFGAGGALQQQLDLVPGQYLPGASSGGGTQRLFTGVSADVLYDPASSSLASDFTPPTIESANAATSGTGSAATTTFQVIVAPGQSSVPVEQVQVVYADSATLGSTTPASWSTLSLSPLSPGSDVWQATLPLPQGASGDWTYFVQAADQAGNVASADGTGSYFTATTAAPVALQVSGNLQASGSYLGRVEVQVSLGSGVSGSATYTLDGKLAAAVPPSGVITVSGDGSHIVTVDATQFGQQVSATQSFTISTPTLVPPAVAFSTTPGAVDGWVPGAFQGGSGSTLSVRVGDANPGATITSLSWSESGAQHASGSESGAAVSLPLDLPMTANGVTQVQVSATDSSGASATASTTVQVDAEAPTLSCSPTSSSSWSAQNVAVTCTASEGESGLAAGTLNAAGSSSSFTLSTSVPSGQESSSAETGSTTVCSAVGYCVQVGPFGPFLVDRIAPEVSITSPADSANFELGQSVTAAYSCSDTGSGLVSCAGSVADGAVLDTSSVGTHQLTVTATDAAGATTTKTVTYTVSYGICDVLPPLQIGHTVLFSIYLCDSQGNDVTTPKTTVTAVSVDGTAAPVPAPRREGDTFTYVRIPLFCYPWWFSFEAYDLNVRNLGEGSHSLTVSVAGDPLRHAIAFTVRR